MNYEIYCDESCPEVLTSAAPVARHLLIGGLMLPAEQRAEIKRRITDLRRRHNTWGEIKWRKVSPSRLPFYLELVDLFFEFGDANSGMRFRCMAVDSALIAPLRDNWEGQVGFCKTAYWQFLRPWLVGGEEYRIFCDFLIKRHYMQRQFRREYMLRRGAELSVADFQLLPSDEVAPMQLCGFLLGAVGCVLNGAGAPASAARAEVVRRLEAGLGRRLGNAAEVDGKFALVRAKQLEAA